MIKYIETNHLKEALVQELFLQIGWETSKQTSEFFDENQTQICAFDAEKLIGFVSGFKNRLDSEGDVAYISFICVLPTYQHLGIGRQLLKRFKEKFADEVLYFLVSAYQNSYTFYEKCGFSYDHESKMMISKT